MITIRARCAFCFAQSLDFPALTREHLMSRPVADAFGIDRTANFARADTGFTNIRWTTVNGVGRRFVCAPCNNGWMNALEHEMAAVGLWVATTDEPLGDHRAQVRAQLGIQDAHDSLLRRGQCRQVR